MNRPLFLIAIVLGATYAPTAEAQRPGAPVDVGIVAFDATPDIVAGMTSEATLLLSNPSDDPILATVTIAYKDGPPVSAPSDPPTNGQVGEQVLLAARAETEYKRFFVPPADQAGMAVLVATVTIREDPDLANNTRELEIMVLTPEIELTVHAPKDPHATPGGWSFIRYTVANKGNAPDSARMTTSLAPRGWDVRILEEHGPIPPGGTANGTVLVRVPLGADAAEFALTISAQSAALARRDAAVASSAPAPALVRDEADPKAKHAVRLESPPPTLEVSPGESIAGRFRVRNTGESTDVYHIEAGIWGSPLGWSVSLGPPGAPAASSHRIEGRAGTGTLVLGLEPGEATEVELRLNFTPSAPPYGRVSINVSSSNAEWLEAWWPAAPFNTTATVSIVAAQPDIAVKRIQAPGSAYEGDRVTMMVDIENRGRLPSNATTLRLELRNNVGVAHSQEFNLSALPSRGNATFQWTFELVGIQGTYALMARAGTTEPDSNRTNNAGSHPLEIRLPRFDVRGPPSVTARPGEQVSLLGTEGSFYVENRARHPETVMARVSSSEGWLVGEWSLQVPAEGRRTIPLNVSVPPAAEGKSVNFTVSVQSLARERFNASVRGTFSVEDVAPPSVELLASEASVLVGQPTALRVRVTDPSGVASVTGRLVDPNGEGHVLDFVPEPGAPDVYSTDFVPAMRGTFVLDVDATDRARPPRSAHVSGLPLSVAAIPYHGLRPTNFLEGSRFSQDFLQFEEASPGRTAEALVDVGNGFHPLVAPYRVDVTGWAEGPQRVRLRALSVEAEEYIASWNVTRDTTPPEIGQPRATLGDDGRLILEVHAPDATSAVAVLETATARVSVTLDPVGTGRFEARVSAPIEWQRVVFAVADSAGNEASATVEKPVEGFVPGVSLTAVVALLLGVALARRTKRGGR